jgi:hypothetical protein
LPDPENNDACSFAFMKCMESPLLKRHGSR